MAKLFLRSGSLDDVLALGENGQPVYAAALQIREALRLKQQQQIADCLAIPQLNEQGDRIDWYAPVEGKVTSWLAASTTERLAAIKQLSACLKSSREMCQRAQQSDNAAQRLFGVLLTKTLQFPDQSYVYIVAGKPVVTFWGFVSQDKKSRSDPLDCLRETAEAIEPTFTTFNAVPTAAISAPQAEPVPVMPAAVPVASSAEPEQPPVAALPTPPSAPAKQVRRWLKFSGLLPVLAVIIALIVQFSGGMPEQATAAVEVTSSATAAQDTAAVAPDIKIRLPALAPQLPLDNAISITPAPVISAPVAAPEVTATQLKNVLILPSDALKVGSTAFLNGQWRVSPDIKTAHTGKAPSLKYQIKNGKGTVKITHGDNVTCRANITAGVMKSGNLVINSRYKAQCSDGSKYQMPEIVCKQGANGIAECKGRYDANTTLPMTMKPETK